MRVAIALTSSSAYISGVQRHAVNLARCLLTRAEIASIHLIAAPWQEASVRDALQMEDKRLCVHISPVANNALSRNLWYYFQLPRIAANLGAEIVHLAFPMPIRRRAYACPVVVTLHDLYPYDAPANFGFPKVLFNKSVLEQCLHSADAVTCVSASTLSRLQCIHPNFPSAKASVVCNCVTPEERLPIRSPLPEWKGEPFLLCVAQHRRNKNLPFLLRVFGELCADAQYGTQWKLVIVGMPGPETRTLKRLLRRGKYIDRVTLLHGITDEELQWCYRRCSLLVAPSTLEGFGLPIAEGLLAGCRVVCSDISAFREVGGAHCDYVPLGPGAVSAFANSIQNALSKAPPPPKSLPQLSTGPIGERYLQLYRSLLQPKLSHDPLAFHTSLPTSSDGAVQ